MSNKFTEEQQDNACAWLEGHCKKSKKSCVCEICGKSEYSMSEDIMRILPNSYQSTVEYPSFMLVCNVCGNTKFFNAIISGIYVPAKEPEEEIDSKASKAEDKKEIPKKKSFLSFLFKKEKKEK